METKERNRTLRNRILTIAVTLLLVLATVLCVTVTVQVVRNGYAKLFGFSFFRVVTGSMEPAVPEGSLIITRQVAIDTIEVGDVICFRSKESYMAGAMITHRVVDILTGEDGSLLLETKGDANLSMDGHYVDEGNFVGKMVWCSDDSFLVSLVSFFTSKTGFTVGIGLPCLLIASYILRGTVGKLKSDMEKAGKEGEEGQGEEEPKGNPQTKSAEPGDESRDYADMVERIRAELIEELKQVDEREPKQR